MVFSEARIATERINNVIITKSVLIKLAAGSVMDKKAHKEFQKTIKSLSDG